MKGYMSELVAELVAETIRMMHIEETDIPTAARIVVNDKGVPELFDDVRAKTAEFLASNSEISRAVISNEQI